MPSTPSSYRVTFNLNPIRIERNCKRRTTWNSKTVLFSINLVECWIESKIVESHTYLRCQWHLFEVIASNNCRYLIGHMHKTWSSVCRTDSKRQITEPKTTSIKRRELDAAIGDRRFPGWSKIVVIQMSCLVIMVRLMGCRSTGDGKVIRPKMAKSQIHAIAIFGPSLALRLVTQ